VCAVLVYHDFFLSGSITSTDGQHFWDLSSEEIGAPVRGLRFFPVALYDLCLPLLVGRSLSPKVMRLHPRAGLLSLRVEEWLVPLRMVKPCISSMYLAHTEIYSITGLLRAKVPSPKMYILGSVYFIPFPDHCMLNGISLITMAMKVFVSTSPLFGMLSYPDLRPANYRAPLAVFVSVCQRHIFEKCSPRRRRGGLARLLELKPTVRGLRRLI
jgi:hypothetical protein